MRRPVGLLALLVCGGISTEVFAGAFEVKTSQGELPQKENERPLALPKALLRVEINFDGTQGLAGFNNNGKSNCDPFLAPGEGCGPTDTPSFLLTILNGNIGANINNPNIGNILAYNRVDSLVTHINAQYGLTDNWLFGFDLPLVAAAENYSNVRDEITLSNQIIGLGIPKRSTIAPGDMKFILGYQFLRDYEGPLRSLLGRIRMKMPTGNESPGSSAKQFRDPETGELRTQDVRSLITGTGTNDADLGVAYKHQLGNALAITIEGGYNVRFPGFVSYMFDESGVQFVDGLRPAAKLDLGDQIYLNGKLTISPSEKWFSTIEVRGLRWGATRVARARAVTDLEIIVDENTTQVRDIFLGPRFLEIPESEGYLVSTTPRFVVQPKDWLEIGAQVDFHLLGKNTNYVRSNTVTQQNLPFDQRFGEVGEEENNFFMLEALGTPLGPFILGTARLGVTFKY